MGDIMNRVQKREANRLTNSVAATLVSAPLGSKNLAPATTWTCPECGNKGQVLLRHEEIHQCVSCGLHHRTAVLIVDGWCL
jgi:predicted RNA-binding Zn-ribbon protein involved in translation (DUF1610 family)